MTGAEMQILRIVGNQDGVGSASVARSMVVSAGFVAALMRSLAESGYIEDAGDGKYAVTRKGQKGVWPYAGRSSGGAFASRFP